MDYLTSRYKQDAPVGSLEAVNNLLSGYSNRKMVESQITRPLNDLGSYRRDVIDNFTVKTYDCAISSSDKIAEMDTKLDEINRKLDKLI